MEYARISHVVTTALHGGDARPCHSQARAVLDVHRIGSAKRRRSDRPPSGGTGATPLQSPHAPPSPRPNSTRVTSTQNDGPSRMGRGANCARVSGTYGSGRRAFPSRAAVAPPPHPSRGSGSQSLMRTQPLFLRPSLTRRRLSSPLDPAGFPSDLCAPRHSPWRDPPRPWA